MKKFYLSEAHGKKEENCLPSSSVWDQLPHLCWRNCVIGVIVTDSAISYRLTEGLPSCCVVIRWVEHCPLPVDVHKVVQRYTGCLCCQPDVLLCQHDCNYLIPDLYSFLMYEQFHLVNCSGHFLLRILCTAFCSQVDFFLVVRDTA